ncbi:MAG: hypothetical protein Q8807_02510 ['Waltheria sp.' little leaf phytoplasma]|nr:hypothetical protein ['Waltheria sp.' little leaf phytoplasma]
MLRKTKKIFVLTTSFIISLMMIVIYYLAQRSNSPSLSSITKVITWNQTPKTQTDYDTALQQWRNQCLFKPGKYTGYEIRNKLGRTNCKLYSDSNNTVTGIYYGKLCDNVLYYKYYEGWLFDVWVLDRFTFLKYNFFDLISRKDEMTVGSSDDGWIRNDFSGYWDTTPPPIKP